MNHSLKALIFNILLLIMEIIGAILCFIEGGKINLKFYTNWSNIIGLISASLFIINYIIKEKNNAFNSVVKYTKLTATVCLTVTFLVVTFMFVPMDHFNYYKLAIKGNFFSFHCLSPIICFITFTFFEKYDFTYIKSTIIGMIFTILYSVIICILILAKKVSAPYPFLDLYAYSVIVNVITLTGMLLAITGLTLLLILIKKKQKCDKIEA